MTAETLALIAGAVLSLAFSYVPGLKDWYDPLEATVKRLIMLGLLVAVALVVFGLSCTGWGAAWNINIPCDQGGAQELISALLVAIVANQGVYALSPRKADDVIAAVVDE